MQEVKPTRYTFCGLYLHAAFYAR